VPRFPPDSFTNLKVLPKNIDQRALLATMRGFAMALGVPRAGGHKERAPGHIPFVHQRAILTPRRNRV